MSACISEPISWLRLERYRLLELAPEAASEVERHLEACAACRACLGHVDAPREIAPLPLPLPARVRPAAPRRRSVVAPVVIGAGILAAAAAAVLWIAPSADPRIPGPHTGIKGGELALQLVRLHAGSTGHDPARFTPGDRFKVQLTCPPGLRGRAHVVVLQAGAAFAPLEPYPLTDCGNLRTWPGAFALDGEAPVTVCVALAADVPPDLGALAKRGTAALPETSVCRRIER